MANDIYPLNQGKLIDNTITTNRIKETNLYVTGKIEALTWVIDQSITSHKMYYNTFSNPNIQPNSIVEIYPNGNEKENLALRNAFLVYKDQTDGKIEFYCYGEVPVIDIPIKVIIRKDMITL